MKKITKSALLLASVLPLAVAAACGQENTGAVSENTTEETAVSTEDTTGNSKESTDGTQEITYDKTVTISDADRSTTNDGVFEGWGTALCWWANRLGYSDTLAQKSADLFYGEDGLRFNIMRYNIGGGDDPTHDHITRTDSGVPGWLYIDSETGEYYYDYDADHNQLNVLKRCYELAGDDAYVEAFANSAPYFMTVSGCTSGAEIATDNNLKEDCYTDFAEYLANVSAYINNELGIKVSSISPMNEPNTNYWAANSPKQEGCHFDPGEVQSTMIVETAKAFENAGLSDVEIVASDETSTIYALDSYQKYSEEALTVLDRVSTHTYDTTGMKSLSMVRDSEGFNLWMSEVDGGNTMSKDAGEMGSALYIADKIISDINGLKPSAWVMWQVIDNHISKDGYNGNTDSGMPDITGGFWGAAVADHDKEEIILTQKYYGIGQFTRYIRPGSTLIITGQSNVLAAIDEDSRTLTVVAYNSKDTDQNYDFTFDGFGIESGSMEVIRTSGDSATGEHWASVDTLQVGSDGFAYVLTPYSITTFVITY